METEVIKIEINKTASSRIAELEEGLKKFGRVFSDHMFIADYKDGTWQNARIVPFGNLSLSPASSVIHYGQSIFEGMKAYKSENDDVLVFRPNENIKRLNISAERMCMPAIPQELFYEALMQLLHLDKNWVPEHDGSSLYIRPFMFATDEYIGVKPSDSYKFMIITTPVGSYYTEPVRVKIEPYYTRAAEGGVGFAKAAGNYAAALYPAKLAQQQGYHQLVWTDYKEHKYIEESGTMNIMFVIGDTLITPSISTTILSGITRDSVITLAKDWGMKVEERKVSIAEVLDAHNKGTLKEAFGTGTAATIAQIATICFQDKDYDLPPIEKSEFSNKVGQYLQNLKKGNIADPHHWVVKI